MSNGALRTGPWTIQTREVLNRIFKNDWDCDILTDGLS